MSTLQVSTAQITTLSDGTNSTSCTNAIQGSAKAWVNFNGNTANPSTIRASYNVSSITKNGTGDYTINLSNPLSDTNFSAVASCSWFGSTSRQIINVASNNSGLVAPTTSTIRIITTNYSSGTVYDSDYIFVSIFR